MANDCFLRGQSLALAWDALTEESDTLLVTECDCTGDCKNFSVLGHLRVCRLNHTSAHMTEKGRPTLTRGDQFMLLDYQGGREFDPVSRQYTAQQ